MRLSETSIEVVRQTLSTPMGWLELGSVALCLVIAWIAARRWKLHSESLQGAARVGAESVNRVIFPLVALMLLVLASAAFHRWHATLFLPLFIPLLITVAAVRIVVFMLRSLFPPSATLLASERTLTLAIWACLILYHVGLLTEVQNSLEEDHFVLGSHEFSLWQVGNALLFIGFTLFVSLWVSRLVEARVMAAKRLDLSLRVVLVKFIRALLLLIGVLVSLDAAGIDVTVLSVFGGAVGVGIGLGLQKIASNYIAGFTILLDRSVRLSDVIAVDNRYGVVTALTARYVVVRSLDGVDAIIPNDTLVTSTVLNYTRSGKEVRLAIPYSVAYDTDLTLAMRILTEAADKHPRVLQGNFAPQAYLVKFGDNGIELELGVWIGDPEKGRLNVISDIHLAVWDVFTKHGIQIPFPQQEIRVVGEPNPLIRDNKVGLPNKDNSTQKS